MGQTHLPASLRRAGPGLPRRPHRSCPQRIRRRRGQRARLPSVRALARRDDDAGGGRFRVRHADPGGGGAGGPGDHPRPLVALARAGRRRGWIASMAHPPDPGGHVLARRPDQPVLLLRLPPAGDGAAELGAADRPQRPPALGRRTAHRPRRPDPGVRSAGARAASRNLRTTAGGARGQDLALGRGRTGCWRLFAAHRPAPGIQRGQVWRPPAERICLAGCHLPAADRGPRRGHLLSRPPAQEPLLLPPSGTAAPWGGVQPAAQLPVDHSL